MKTASKKPMISAKLRETIANNRDQWYKTHQGGTPYWGFSSADKMSFARPVLKSGKPSRYLSILVSLGEAGSTWEDALREVGKEHWDAPSMLCCMRHAFLHHGLIEAAGKIGRKTKWRLTKLGTRYVDAAMKHVHM